MGTKVGKLLGMFFFFGSWFGGRRVLVESSMGLDLWGYWGRMCCMRIDWE